MKRPPHHAAVLSVVRRWVGSLGTKLRPHRAFLSITAGVFVLYSAMFFYLRPGPGHSDGFYSYMFARSLAFDGDVELTNDYAICGDPWGAGRDRGTGHPDNQAYIGPALIWTPILAVARHAVSFPADTPAAIREGCAGPLARLTLFSTVIVGALAIGLAFLSARRFTDTNFAAVAALLFAVGSSLPHYVGLFPSYSHAYAAFAAALLFWMSVRANDAGRLVDYVPASLAGALCATQRLSDACLILIPLAFLVAAPKSRGFKLAAAAVIAGGTLLGVAVTLSLYAYLYGSPFVLPQGRHYIHIWHAHPLLVLFAPHGGLLYATPIAYLGLVGFGVGLSRKQTRAMTLGALGAFSICLWLSSAALDWHGSGTFGARRLLSMLPVLIVFSALALDRGAAFLRKHLAVIATGAVLLLCGVPVVGSTLAVKRGEFPVDTSGAQAVQYASGSRAVWATFDERLGDLAILPAELVYSARYGLPMRSFRAATSDKFYRRSFHTLEWEPRGFDFNHPTLLEASAGLAASGGGAKLVGRDAKSVFAAAWPFATSAELTLDANQAVSVELTLGTFFRSCRLGSRALEPGAAQRIRWTIPPGCFDSGLMELSIQTSGGDPGAILLSRLTFDDERSYPPSY